MKVAHHAASDKLVARIEAVIASGRRLAPASLTVDLPPADESTCAGASGILMSRALGDRM